MLHTVCDVEFDSGLPRFSVVRAKLDGRKTVVTVAAGLGPLPNQSKAVAFAMGYLKRMVVAGEPVPTEGLKLPYGPDGSALAGDELERILGGEPVHWGPPAAFRRLVLRQAYQSLTNGRNLRKTDRPSPVSQSDWRVAVHYLVSDGSLEVVPDRQAYCLTHRGIDAVEGFRDPSMRSGLAFIVMPFHPEIDAWFDGPIKGVCRRHGLEPCRIDRDPPGEPVITGIQALIRAADIVIADLTWERPNCYYEVGYAHALRKPMILTARRDHAPEADPKGGRVHFDAAAYSIVFWDDADFPTFEGALGNAVSNALDTARTW